MPFTVRWLLQFMTCVCSMRWPLKKCRIRRTIRPTTWIAYDIYGHVPSHSTMRRYVQATYLFVLACRDVQRYHHCILLRHHACVPNAADIASQPQYGCRVTAALWVGALANIQFWQPLSSFVVRIPDTLTWLRFQDVPLTLY
jgi:hypothetical protein